ncbi:MAG: hypothetical protein IJ437_07390 [Clostridia bacterium]|nr:hypothetical protein [Clostridia bacterium]
MKKILSLTLILLMLGCLLIACTPADTDLDSDTDTATDTELGSDDEINDNTDTEEASDTSKETSKDSETDTETNTDTATDASTDIETDTKTNTNTTTDTSTDTATDTSTDTSTETEMPSTPSENTQTITWQFNYDYGFHEENLATLLVDYSKLTHGFENVTIPDDIVAGDTITIEYTGDMYTLEIYPGITELYGEVISYSFKYASVTKDVLTASTIDRIRAEYDIKDEYVIINRGGEYKTLEECMGRYIYLVTDQKRAKEQSDTQKLPIASIYIFDPRDLKSGLSPFEPRNEKVSFDLDYHLLDDELEKEDYKEDPTKFDFGYICNDQNGNEFIAYAPNLYSYTVLIECTEENAEAYNGIRSVLNQFNPWNSTDRGDIDIDAQDLPNNMILITFPDFDTYFTCQDELLDKLSVLECVKKIHVSYISSQNGTYSPKNPYEVYADAGSSYHKNDVFTTYEEYVNALGTCIENSAGLQKITESIFENNYVFVVTNWHWRELEISDARLVGDTVYFTNNAYQAKGQLHDMIGYENSCVIVVPKSEIGELPENVTVKTVNATVYIDGLANLTKIDEGDAITIAFAHFYANYNPTTEEGFAYVAQSIDGENANYWYILIHKKYVGNTDEYDYVVKGGGFLYTISKNSGEIISIELGE